jgi:hypothetical protein
MHDENVNPNDPDAVLPERVVTEIKRNAPALVRNLIFTGEAELDGAIVGDAGFEAYFSALGPFDQQGRSLRQFDGKTRMFKYPCSYMIYSDSFEMLPVAYKQEVFRMLHEILTSPEPGEDFAHLSDADKTAVIEILKATVPELSKDWN